MYGETMAMFCERQGIRCESEMIEGRPDGIEICEGGYNWRVTLYRRGPRRQFSLYFYTGSAFDREPTATDVLGCLASDAASLDNALSFEDWAADLGYDPDSRRAERTYRLIVTQTERLRRFLGREYREALCAEW